VDGAKGKEQCKRYVLEDPTLEGVGLVASSGTVAEV
jgi:hypothetical protein